MATFILLSRGDFFPQGLTGVTPQGMFSLLAIDIENSGRGDHELLKFTAPLLASMLRKCLHLNPGTSKLPAVLLVRNSTLLNTPQLMHNQESKELRECWNEKLDSIEEFSPKQFVYLTVYHASQKNKTTY